MKRRGILLLVAGCLLLALVSCSNTSVNPSPSVEPATQSPSATPKLPASETTDKISVTMEVDEALAQAIVTVVNGSTYTFDGYIHVFFFNTDEKLVGLDMILVDELPAGNSTYARVSLDAVSPGITMEYQLSEKATFTPGVALEGGQLNEDISTELATDFEGNFGGAGNSEYATSWYHYVVSIQVFAADSTKYAVITVSDDATSEAIDRIGNAIYGNYAKKYSLSKVVVNTESGENVFTKE